ncbi:MAG: proton-conducting transporter membrane subunit [Coriobacteriia bacterium]|nr:proton-conducting transporter membrane subunit [Coriobacteriia bacterium]
MMTTMPGISTLRFAIDEISLPFLLLFSAVWILSGLYTAATLDTRGRGRLFAYFIPSAIGGIGVAVAADAISFYLCFALMAIPAWGLIVHSGSAESRRAGAIYLTLTVIGEAVLLAALVLLAVESGTTLLADYPAVLAELPSAPLITGLVLAMIALKIGTLPFSGFLPLSYTYTPAGPAAALAGASAKVGALAMLRLLPAGGMAPEWSSAVMLIGLATAFGAAVLGVLTTHPRAVLGYSSASQLGLISIAAGAGLSDPGIAVLATGAVVAFSIHHGLAKAALVLGDDIVARLEGAQRKAALVALGFPALALVGAPLTSGFVAKYALKDAVHALSGPVPDLVYTLISWSAVGTAALMVRFFVLATRQDRIESRPVGVPVALWSALLALVAGAAWLWPASWNDHAAEAAFAPASIWTALWPGLIALAGWLALTRLAPHRDTSALRVTPGDLLVSAADAVGRLGDTEDHADAPTADSLEAAAVDMAEDPLVRAEQAYLRWTVAATTFVLLGVLLVWLAHS